MAYFNHMFCFSKWCSKYQIVWLGKKGLDAADARNRLVQRAMDENCSHILFIDGDHLLPVEMLNCLWETKDEAMVSGLVCKKGEGYQQVGYQKINGKYYPVDLPLDGRLYEVRVCAFGCTLINLDCLKKLEEPYFRDTCVDIGDGKKFNFRSDINLCEAFVEKGMKCWIDTRVLIGHMGMDKVVYPQTADAMNMADKVLRKSEDIGKNGQGYYYASEL